LSTVGDVEGEDIIHRGRRGRRRLLPVVGNYEEREKEATVDRRGCRRRVLSTVDGNEESDVVECRRKKKEREYCQS
jgi:hypothetical protein